MLHTFKSLSLHGTRTPSEIPNDRIIIEIIRLTKGQNLTYAFVFPINVELSKYNNVLGWKLEKKRN